MTCALCRKLARVCRRMKRSRHLPFIPHGHATQYDLHHSSTPYQTIYKPAFSRTGSDDSQIASYIETKFSDVLHRAEEVGTLSDQGSQSEADFHCRDTGGPYLYARQLCSSYCAAPDHCVLEQPDDKHDRGKSYLLPMDHEKIEECLNRLQESLLDDVSTSTRYLSSNKG